MWIKLIVIIFTIHISNWQSFGINFIDLPGFGTDGEKSNVNRNGASDSDIDGTTFRVPKSDGESEEEYMKRRAFHYKSTLSTSYRRHWLVSAPVGRENIAKTVVDDQDENLKNKINMLVQQTMHDTELKVKSVEKIKDKHKDDPSYRVGFILSMIKKSRDVLNELFNVAVKHRDEWKALEQLKIFELIVHTNVDTTNLVRQLVEIHISNLNNTGVPNKSVMRSNTNSTHPANFEKGKVVLL